MKMTDEELKTFIEKIGRSELFDEKRLKHIVMHGTTKERVGAITSPTAFSLGSIYRKAIEATLCALGYDEDFIGDVKSAFYDRYYPETESKNTNKLSEKEIREVLKDYGKEINEKPLVIDTPDLEIPLEDLIKTDEEPVLANIDEVLEEGLQPPFIDCTRKSKEKRIEEALKAIDKEFKNYKVVYDKYDPYEYDWNGKRCYECYYTEITEGFDGIHEEIKSEDCPSCNFDKITLENCSIVAKHLICNNKVKFDEMPVNLTICYAHGYWHIYYNAEKEIIDRYLEANKKTLEELAKEMKEAYGTLQNAVEQLKDKTLEIVRVRIVPHLLAVILHDYPMEGVLNSLLDEDDEAERTSEIVMRSEIEKI